MLAHLEKQHEQQITDQKCLLSKLPCCQSNTAAIPFPRDWLFSAKYKHTHPLGFSQLLES